MTWPEAFGALDRRIASRHELLAIGASPRALTSAVRHGQLIRVRRDHYALPNTSRFVVEAVRIGGRLGCLSALADAGLFAIESRFTHAHLPRDASRLRHPRDRAATLHERPLDGVQLHWSTLVEPHGGDDVSVSVLDALVQVARCQHPWHAVASIDSALHHGAVSLPTLNRELERTRAGRPLIELVDARAESGQESVLRMIVRGAGLQFEPQVEMPGIGRVDFVVEGCLVVEADSRQAHDGWALHVRDRNRDLDLARLGYMSLRPVYQRIMFTPHDVRDAIIHLLRVNRHFRRHI